VLSIIEFSSFDGPAHIGISSKEKGTEFYLGAGLYFIPSTVDWSCK
jgi:hypothetical protein